MDILESMIQNQWSIDNGIITVSTEKKQFTWAIKKIYAPAYIKQNVYLTRKSIHVIIRYKGYKNVNMDIDIYINI